MQFRLGNYDSIGFLRDNMKHILYLSSWRVFDAQKNIVEVPFIYEQIASLSSVVDATYAEYDFKSFISWIPLFITGRWIQKNDNSLWNSKNYRVQYFKVFLPKFSSRLTRNALWQDYYLSGRWLAKMLARRLGRFDVIHTHVVLPIGGFAVALGSKWKIPFILQEHSGPFEMHCKGAIQESGVRFVLERCDLKLPVSKALQNRMQLYDEKMNYRIAPNLIRTDIFKPCGIINTELKNDIIKIISVCSAQEVKRHDLMFLALKELHAMGKSAHLTLYGVDETCTKLVELRNHLGLNASISLMGKTDKNTIYRAYCKHDVYLCTSDFETFGLAPAEAICTGLPLVTSDCGGVDEFVNLGNAIVVPKQEATLFAEAIEKVKDWSSIENTAWRNIDNTYGKRAFNAYWINLYNELTSL